MNRSKYARAAYPVILFALVVVAIWPFLARQGLPRDTDAELHVFRLAELASLVSTGELYPRWAPHFFYGYGYPIFNYYAPLAYYLGLPVTLITGFDAVAGVKAVFALTFLAGALGIFGYVRDFWGRRAALISAAIYIYSPYLLYVDPHARGDLAEFLSFGVFPIALWSYGRLLVKQTRARFLAALLSTALVILSHNLMAMVFFALLCAWVLWQSGVVVSGMKQTAPVLQGARAWFVDHGLWMVIALLLGVGVAAFFWLPVALEQDAVNLSRLIGDGGHFDFRNHFLSLQELLGPATWLDWGATEPDFTLNLGMMQWLMALLGVGGIVTGIAAHRGQASFFVVAALSLVFLMTPWSAAIWEAVPLMPFLQFPWRLLGPAAAVMAVLGGIGVHSLLRLTARNGHKHHIAPAADGGVVSSAVVERILRAAQPWIPGCILFLVLCQTLPLMMVPPWPQAPWDTSTRAIIAIERQGKWIGTTSTADFVPSTVDVLPSPQGAMLNPFMSGEPLDRVNYASVPDSARVRSEALTPLHTRYVVNTNKPFPLRLFQFAFPGWEVTIDGEIVEAQIGRPEGFIVIPVPEGEHVVEVYFTETTERSVAWLTTSIALLLAVGLAFLLKESRVSALNSDDKRPFERPFERIDATTIRIAALAFALFLAIFFASHRYDLFHFRSTGWTAIPAEHKAYHDLGGQIALIGYDLEQRAQPGEVVEVTLYWKAQRDLQINYQVFVHLLDESGIPVTQSDKLNPGEFPTNRWPTDQYVRDVHRLQLPELIEPGSYTFSAGLWVQTEGWRLPYFDEEGNQIGDNVSIGQLEVR